MIGTQKSVGKNSDVDKKYIIHINYELEQFYESAKGLAEITKTSFTKATKEHRPYLELFLLHTRNLYEFFCGSLEKDTNLLKASTYTKAPIDSAYLEETKNPINIFVSHLSKERDFEQIWEVDRILNEVYRCHSSFYSRLKDEFKREFRAPGQYYNHTASSCLDITSTLSL